MSDIFSKKFEIAWTKLNECQYELPIEIKPLMKEALQTAGFATVITISNTSNTNTNNTETKTKKMSSYNIFMQQKMAVLKAEGVPSGERMGKVASLWKALSDEDKAQFKSSNPGTTGTTTAKVADPSKVHKLTGYQLFVKETMPEVKADTNVLPKERLTAIAKKWKVLTDDEKTAFKTKASTL